MDDKDDTADQQSIPADQQSLGSVSTFDLPSPALSLKSAVKKASQKPEKTDKGNWVWHWAEKQSDTSGNVRVYCKIPCCLQKRDGQ